jgi:membrane-associated phospholipid phosphatase
MKRLHTGLALVALLAAGASNARADVVLDWNAIAIATLGGQNPFDQARYMAITQIAVFEAVNAVTRAYEPYQGTVVAPSGARPDAAAVAAAYTVLKTYFPAAANLDPAYAASLGAIPDSPGKLAGIAVGQASAAQMVLLRASDGSAPPAFSLPASSEAGVWQPTPFCPPMGGVFYHWQNVTPFGIPAVLRGRPWLESFRLDPPPALVSSRYARDYAEVQAVGNVTSDSSQRPADRALVAQFYAVTSPTTVFNSVARQIAAARAASLAANARMLALLNMAINDSQVATFGNKYYYNRWRPVTAIRAGDADGNSRTNPDALFTPFVVTPCFPSYPSNHGSASGSGAEILSLLFGDAADQITVLSPAMPGIAMHYTALSQITADIDDARVYGGIHFRYDQVAGGVLGRAVADYIYAHNLRRLGGPVERH